MSSQKLACLNSVKRTQQGGKRSPVEKKYVDLVVVIDRSGSVHMMDTRGWQGFKQLIKEQKKTSKDENVVIHVTLITFDGAATTWYADKDVTTLPDFFPDDELFQMFSPRGSTLLVDTLFEAAIASTRRYNALVDTKGEDNVSSVLLVWTDGDDNQSHKWTVQDLNRMLSKIQENPKRTILFTAANQDAVRVGATFGIAASNCLTTQATPGGAAPMYRACSAAVTRGCSGGNAAFTPQERASNSRAATQPAPIRAGQANQNTPVPLRWVPGSFAGGGLRHNNNAVMATGRHPPRPPFFGNVGSRGSSCGGHVAIPLAPPPVAMHGGIVAPVAVAPPPPAAAIPPPPPSN